MQMTLYKNHELRANEYQVPYSMTFVLMNSVLLIKSSNKIFTISHLTILSVHSHTALTTKVPPWKGTGDKMVGGMPYCSPLLAIHDE